MEKSPKKKLDICVRWKYRSIIRVFRHYFKDEEIMAGSGFDDSYCKGLDISSFGIKAGMPNIIVDESNWKDLANDSHVKWFIIVHFPKLHVENSYGNSIDVEDLYAAAAFSGKSFIGLYSEVTTFALSKAIKGYGFSHMQTVKFNSLKFEHCCLGKDQLSKYQTIMSDDNWYASMSEEDIQFTYLNIAQCIRRNFHLESTSGTPYIRMSNVTINPNKESIDEFRSYELKLTRPYNVIMDNAALQLVINESMMRLASMGKYYCQTSVMNDMLVSEAVFMPMLARFINDFTPIFKSVYNEHLLLDSDLISIQDLISKGVLADMRITNDKIYIIRTNNGPGTTSGLNLLMMDGQDLFLFNGKQVKLHIYNDMNIELCNIKLYLTPSFALDCLHIYNNMFYGKR